MPFTPSHAVAALPFARSRVVPAAVAIGAMAPDLPLFLRWSDGYGLAHDARWLPLTMVLAFALLLVWRMLLRPVARELAPNWLAERLPAGWSSGPRAAWAEAVPSVRAIGWLILALGVGVLSHIGWDAFTHEGRAGAALLPGLETMWGPFPGYRWFQYGSSVFGLAVLGVAGLIWLARTPRIAGRGSAGPAAIRVSWWVSLPVTLVVAWVVGLGLFGPLDESFTVRHLAYRVLPLACAIWGAATFVLCLVLVAKRPATRPADEYDLPRP